MASLAEDHLQCPTCLEIFRDPVVLPCSHNFCRACVQQWWEQKGDRTCPVCRTEFRSIDVPLNLALKNICEAFSQASVESDDICSLHKEKLKLFCVDHQELVCHICRDSKIHAGHKFFPFIEVHENHKDKLQDGLQDAKKRLKNYIETRDNCNEQATYIKVQREQAENKIKMDFEELHRFLQAEEEARLSAVREEEEEKSRMMKEKIQALSRDMAALSDEIRSTEEQLTSDPVSFMKNFKDAMTKIQKLPDEPKLLSGALLDEVNPLRHRTCPVCRTEFRSMDPLLNLALKNMCEVFSQASVESDDICSLHKEKLKLFCVDHQELVCLICRDSKIHAGHKFFPFIEVHEDHKDKLQDGLQDAKERLKDYIETRDNCNEQAMYIRVQREQVENKIKMDFKELRRFLQAEEEARLSAVREEEEEKSRMMKEKIQALSRDMAALSDEIRSTEEQLTSDPVSFMKNFKDAMTKIQKLPDEPKLLSGALLDEVKHVGNLKFSVWERMKEMVFYSPVILDPNTAYSDLSLSEDLTSVSCQKEHQRPNNPERAKWNYLLGSALVSQTPMWDVEVGDNRDWGLGVAWGDSCLPHSMECWRIAFRDDKYRKFGGSFGSWNPPVKLQKIRVHVDMNERSVSFSESHTNTELCKTEPSEWPPLSDNMKMFPCFYTTDKIPLQIIPLACRVTTQSQ
ncbi:tripartite motif-containing protein 75-like [Vanacampus margaritifer]